MIASILTFFLVFTGVEKSFATPTRLNSKPDQEEILETKVLDVDLYVVSVAVKENTLSVVQVVWLPPSVEKGCINLSLNSCRKVDHERRMEKLNEQRDNKLNRLKEKFFHEIPTRMLDWWVVEKESNLYPENKKVIEFLSKQNWMKELILGVEGEKYLETISPRNKFRAKIRWKMWTNGEGSKVLEVYP